MKSWSLLFNPFYCEIISVNSQSDVSDQLAYCVTIIIHVLFRCSKETFRGHAPSTTLSYERVCTRVFQRHQRRQRDADVRRRDKADRLWLRQEALFERDNWRRLSTGSTLNERNSILDGTRGRQRGGSWNQVWYMASFDVCLFPLIRLLCAFVLPEYFPHMPQVRSMVMSFKVFEKTSNLEFLQAEWIYW